MIAWVRHRRGSFIDKMSHAVVVNTIFQQAVVHQSVHDSSARPQRVPSQKHLCRELPLFGKIRHVNLLIGKFTMLAAAVSTF